MTQSIGLLDLTVTAMAAITGGSLVTFAGAPSAAAGGKVMGVAVYGVSAAGYPLPVRVFGTAAALTGGAVAVGDALASDVNGHVVTSVNGTDFIVGYALEAAAASGDAIQILLRR